jgi:hypothetical protein
MGDLGGGRLTLPPGAPPADVMGFVTVPNGLLGYSAPTSPPQAERATEAALQVARSWAGLTSQGRILISIEQLASGQDVNVLISHESVHDVLIYSSVLGIQQLALSAFGMPPWPEFSLSGMLRRILSSTVRASLRVQEGCATYLPSLGRNATELTAYLTSLPPEYRDLVQPLEWLRTRGLEGDAATRLVFAIGRFSLGVRLPAGMLSDPAALARFLRDPDHNPNERFAAACAALKSTDDAELLRLSEVEEPEVEIAQRWHCEVTGHPAPHAHAPPDRKQWLALWREIVAEMASAWAGHPRMSQSEREYLHEATQRPELLLQPPSPSVLKAGLTHTVSLSGSVADHPAVSSLIQYELALISYNAFGKTIPGIESVSGGGLPLAAGEAALWLASPTRQGAAVRLSDSELREYLSAAEPDTTICVYDGDYVFPAGDFLTGQPLFRDRAHLVLVANRSLGALLNDPTLSMGLAGQAELRYAIVGGEVPGVSYFLAAPKNRPYPVLVVPAPWPTSARARQELRRDGGGDLRWTEVESADFFRSAAATDLLRLFTWFEDQPWAPSIQRQPSPLD